MVLKPLIISNYHKKNPCSWLYSLFLTTELHGVRHRVAQCLLFLSATVNIEGYYYLATRRIHIGISPLCYPVNINSVSSVVKNLSPKQSLTIKIPRTGKEPS